MGGCQSKKPQKQPIVGKGKGTKSTPSGGTTAGGTKSGPPGVLKKDQTQQKQQTKKTSSIEAAGGPVEELKDDGDMKTQLLISSFDGNDASVKDLIKKLKLSDISNIRGYQGTLSLGHGSYTKRYQSTANWNPLLLAISQRHLNVVQTIFQQVCSFHKINCISKPYDIEVQKQKIFDHKKRLKRECFGLKLSILNKDEAMFKFLWTEQRHLWNLGHFFLCQQLIIKSGWEHGLKQLISSSTSKVLFMSVNTVDHFIEVIDFISDELDKVELINPDMSFKIQEFFLSRPYYIYCFFLEIVQQQENANLEFLRDCIDKLNQDDVPFKHADIDEIFQVLDEKNKLVHVKDMFFAKFENRDQEIEDLQNELVRLFEDEKSKDSEDYVQILEELDLFAFSELKVKGKQTNALVQALNRRFEKIVDYTFSEGFTNIRSLFKVNNRLEMDNDVARFNVEFFIINQNSIGFFTQMYRSLVDLMQLSNFLEIFVLSVTGSSKIKNSQAFEFILNDEKFISLFETSLELQKYIFMREIKHMFSASQSPSTQAILKILQDKDPYKKYFQAISRGQTGEVFAQKTINHLQKLAEEREKQMNEEQKKEHDEFIKQNQEQIQSIQKLVMTDQPVFGQQRNSIAMRNSIMAIRMSAHPNQALGQSANPALPPTAGGTDTGPKNNIGIAMTDQMRVTLSHYQQQKIPMRKTQGLYKAMAMRKSQGAHLLNQGSPMRNTTGGGPGNPAFVQQKALQLSAFYQAEQASLTVEPIVAQQQQQPVVMHRPEIVPNFQKLQAQDLSPKSQAILFVLKDEDTFADKQQLLMAGAAQQVPKNDDQQVQVSAIVLEEKKANEGKNGIKQDADDSEEIEGELREEPAELLAGTGNLSVRQPYVVSKRDLINTSDMPELYDPIKARENFEKLPVNIIECVIQNNIAQIKQLLKSFNIRNVCWIRNEESEPSKVRGRDGGNPFGLSGSAEKSKPGTRTGAGGTTGGESIKDGTLLYDTRLWNPILFAIYFQRVEILRLFMNEYVINFILALRLPPVDDYTEYIIPPGNAAAAISKSTPGSQPWTTSKQDKKLRQSSQHQQDSQEDEEQDLCMQAELVPWQGFINVARNTNIVNYYYNPSDARVECFGLELAIRNRDLTTLTFLWTDQSDKWEERHFAHLYDKMLQVQWDQGLEFLFRSKTSHRIFKALNPEDKDNFMNSKIVDKITDTEFWESAQSPIKVSDRTVSIVIQELQNLPYGGYAVLKFPKLFQSKSLLEQTLTKVIFDDIFDFTMARKENLAHLEGFVAEFSRSQGASQKCKKALEGIIKKAQQGTADQKKLPPSPEKLISLIKLGNMEGMKKYLHQGDNSAYLELLNQMQGFEDDEYPMVFQSHVKSIPADDTIHLLLEDNTTMDWNPLVFSIFYQKREFVEFFCEHKSVYVRNCLTSPFIVETGGEEQLDQEEEEKFIQEKTELFCLVLCIMLQNRDIFRYLLKKCSFLWNEIHLVLLTNYVFDALWGDGIKMLFTSAATHQIFNAMNLYEKEKYLKFCEKSILMTNNDQVIRDFRYHMAFEPYNIHYLPILAQPEEIRYWDQDPSKELFLKNCQLNFDERAFALLSKLNNHYVIEFITSAITAESDVLVSFARKLKRFIPRKDQPILQGLTQ